MTRTLLLLLLVACEYELPPPERPDASVEIDASYDASPDAQECWRTHEFWCNGSLWAICIPYDGCSPTFLCPGDTGPPMQLCGPGWES